MSDQAEGPVANAGQTVQKGLNQVGSAKDRLSEFIRARPICAALIAVGIGYVIGKVI
jgi:hypothetical protein